MKSRVWEISEKTREQTYKQNLDNRKTKSFPRDLEGLYALCSKPEGG